MIKKIISLFIILSMIIALNPFTMNKSTAATKPLNILFIGNSKTYYNNMPTMLSNMLIKSGKKNNYQVLVKGSMSLNFHYHYIKNHQEQIQGIFNGEKIDYVILNEQTDVQLAPFGTEYDSNNEKPDSDKYYTNKRIFGNLSKDAKRVLNKLYEYKMITKKGTKIILNATWNYADLNVEELDISNNNFEQTRQVILNAGYKNCEIAYSGTVVKNVFDEMDKANGELTKQELFADEKEPRKHTTQVGSYIEALTLYKAMFSTNMTADYAGSISADKMASSTAKYIVIDEFTYKGFTYSNTPDFMKKVFNRSDFKKITEYKKIRDFVNKII